MNRKTVHRALTALGLLVVLATVVFILIRWRVMPDEIATHYDAAGQIDGWDRKGTIFILPAVTLSLFGLMSIPLCIPTAAWGLPTRNVENARLALAIVRLLLTVFFGYMTVCSVMCRPLGQLFVPVFLGSEAAALAAFLLCLFRPAAKS